MGMHGLNGRGGGNNTLATMLSSKQWINWISTGKNWVVVSSGEGAAGAPDLPPFLFWGQDKQGPIAFPGMAWKAPIEFVGLAGIPSCKKHGHHDPQA